MDDKPRLPDADWLAHLLGTGSEHAIIILDNKGVIVQWLGGAERRFGYTSAQAVGLDFSVLFTAEDVRLGSDRQEMAVAAASNRSEDERWHVRKDGSRFWGSGSLEAVRKPDGMLSGFCKVLRDRTDVRTQLDALQNRLAFNEAEQRRRSNAVVLLGHELRNVLGPIQNATSAMVASDDPALRSRCLGILERQVSAMATLLDDLGEASVATLSPPRLKKEPVIVQDALDCAASSLRTSMEQKGQALVVTVSDVPFAVDADPARLQQMLLNLLGNASKYTASGGHIHLTAAVEGSEAVIRITDDGIGISPRVLPHIFDLFTRGDPSGTPPGLGVGLAVVRELAALHGGGIQARSRGEGKGSVFILRLPLSGETREPRATNDGGPGSLFG